MCPHTTTHVSSYYYMCPHTTKKTRAAQQNEYTYYLYTEWHAPASRESVFYIMCVCVCVCACVRVFVMCVNYTEWHTPASRDLCRLGYLVVV